jgi:hypothetical protein
MLGEGAAGAGADPVVHPAARVKRLHSKIKRIEKLILPSLEHRLTESLISLYDTFACFLQIFSLFLLKPCYDDIQVKERFYQLPLKFKV